MNQRTDDDQITRLIDTGTDLDPNLVAAYIDGGLSPAERLALERRMAADPEAQLLARTIRERTGRPGLWLPVGAIAAAILVGVLLWKRGPASVPALDERLATVVAALRTDGGDAFADFALLGKDELATARSTKRGGGTWLYPRGTLLNAPTAFRWENPEGSEQVRLTLQGPGVRWTQDVSGSETQAPALPAGRFVVTLQALDTLAGQKQKRSFVVADAAKRKHFLETMDTIRAKASDDLEDLVVAHFALRHQLFGVARSSVQRAETQSAEVRAAAERLAQHIEAIQGR